MGKKLPNFSAFLTTLVAIFQNIMNNSRKYFGFRKINTVKGNEYDYF